MTERIKSLARRYGVPVSAAVLAIVGTVYAAQSNATPRQWTDAQIKSEFEGNSAADVMNHLGERNAKMVFLGQGPRPGWITYRLLVGEPRGSYAVTVELCVLNGRVSGVNIRHDRP
jgi:hypothetical protein